MDQARRSVAFMVGRSVGARSAVPPPPAIAITTRPTRLIAATEARSLADLGVLGDHVAASDGIVRIRVHPRRVDDRAGDQASTATWIEKVAEPSFYDIKTSTEGVKCSREIMSQSAFANLEFSDGWVHRGA